MGILSNYITQKVREVLASPKEIAGPLTGYGGYDRAARMGTDCLFEVAKIENGYLIGAYSEAMTPRYTYVENTDGLGEALTAILVQNKLNADALKSDLGQQLKRAVYAKQAGSTKGEW